jgi:anthranilate phosphoribosyltransferase
VSSADGLDEMSTSGTTRVVEVDGRDCALRGRPEDVGLAAAASGRRRRHAGRQRRATRRIFAGEPARARPGVLNAGAAIYVSGRVASLEEACAPPSRLTTAAPRRARRAHRTDQRAAPLDVSTA